VGRPISVARNDPCRQRKYLIILCIPAKPEVIELEKVTRNSWRCSLPTSTLVGTEGHERNESSEASSEKWSASRRSYPSIPASVSLSSPQALVRGRDTGAPAERHGERGSSPSCRTCNDARLANGLSLDVPPLGVGNSEWRANSASSPDLRGSDRERTTQRDAFWLTVGHLPSLTTTTTSGEQHAKTRRSRATSTPRRSRQPRESAHARERAGGMKESSRLSATDQRKDPSRLRETTLAARPRHVSTADASATSQHYQGARDIGVVVRTARQRRR